MSKFKIGDEVIWNKPLASQVYDIYYVINDIVYLRYSNTTIFAGYIVDLTKIRKLTKLEKALK